MFEVIKSNTEITVTPPRIAQFGTEFHPVTGDTLQMSKVKGQSQGHCVK